MNGHENDVSQKKKPYAKPRLEQVALRAEEAVLANCKLNSTTPGNRLWKNQCSNPGGQLQCQVLGS
jgi:hypothetical protein